MIGHAKTEEEAKRLAGPGGLYWKSEDMKWAAKFAFLFCLIVGVIALALLIYFEPAFGQEAKLDKPPQLSADSRISLLKLQLKQKQLESQFLQMQQELNRIQGQYNDGVKALQDAIEAAYKEAKLDKKEWVLNLETLEFTKIPTPPKPAEVKKP